MTPDKHFIPVMALATGTVKVAAIHEIFISSWTSISKSLKINQIHPKMCEYLLANYGKYVGSEGIHVFLSWTVASV